MHKVFTCIKMSLYGITNLIALMYVLQEMLKLQSSMGEEKMAEKVHTIEQLQIVNEDLRKKLHVAKKGKITHLIEKLTRPKGYKRKIFSQRKMSKNDKRKFRHKDYMCF